MCLTLDSISQKKFTVDTFRSVLEPSVFRTGAETSIHRRYSSTKQRLPAAGRRCMRRRAHLVVVVVVVGPHLRIFQLNFPHRRGSLPVPDCRVRADTPDRQGNAGKIETNYRVHISLNNYVQNRAEGRCQLAVHDTAADGSVLVRRIPADFRTMLAMSRVEPVRNTSRNQTKDVGVSKNRSRIPATTVSTTEISKKKELEDGTTSINKILHGEEDEKEEAVVDDATLADTPEISTRVTPSIELSTDGRQTTTVSAPSPTVSLSTSSTTSRVPSSGTTEDTKTTSTPKKAKMPRVTLKLRQNETIPQMYMKAGIASYKKGNITTSVLAPRLSLEGLIFKTPEGTIKPWPQKWFFSDPSADFQWKGSTQMPVTIYVVLAGLAALASVSIVLMFYVQRKASRRQRSNVEEPEVEEHEEDKSTLLGAESQEAEEKE